MKKALIATALIGVLGISAVMADDGGWGWARYRCLPDRIGGSMAAGWAAQRRHDPGDRLGVGQGDAGPDDPEPHLRTQTRHLRGGAERCQCGDLEGAGSTGGAGRGEARHLDPAGLGAAGHDL